MAKYYDAREFLTKSDEDLLAIWEQRQDYVPDVIEIVMNELLRRGVTVPQVPQPGAKEPHSERVPTQSSFPQAVQNVQGRLTPLGRPGVRGITLQAGHLKEVHMGWTISAMTQRFSYQLFDITVELGNLPFGQRERTVEVHCPFCALEPRPQSLFLTLSERTVVRLQQDEYTPDVRARLRRHVVGSFIPDLAVRAIAGVGLLYVFLWVVLARLFPLVSGSSEALGHLEGVLILLLFAGVLGMLAFVLLKSSRSYWSRFSRARQGHLPRAVLLPVNSTQDFGYGGQDSFVMVTRVRKSGGSHILLGVDSDDEMKVLNGIDPDTYGPVELK